MLAVSTNNILGDISFLDLVNVNLTKPETFLKLNINNVDTIEYKIPKKETPAAKTISDPLVYIYNTHQSEEYSAGSLANYNITPTVYMASNILKKVLLNNNINSVVEDENIKDILNANGWKYNMSYEASLIWLKRCKEKYPTIKYFIDVHRDSVSGNITINDRIYAKMVFVVGMNHENYKQNEELMIRLNSYLNEHYNGVMRDMIYGKKNRFNQDFDPNSILIEIGGLENNINEIYNSTLILGEALTNVIGG